MKTMENNILLQTDRQTDRQTSYDWLRVVLVIFEVIGHATYLDIKTPFGSV